MEKNKKIAIGLGIALVVVILLSIVAYFVIGNNYNEKINKKTEQVKKNYTDSLKIAYNKGIGEGKDIGYDSGYSEAATTYQDSLDADRKALADCMGKKKAKSNVKKTTTTNATKPVEKEKKAIVTTADQFKPPVKEKPMVKEFVKEQSISTNTATPVSGLSPKHVGKIGRTISEDGHVEIFLSNEGYNEAGGTAVPEISYPGSGKFMTLIGDYWIYVEKRIIVTNEYLSQQACAPLTISIGDGKGYPAFVPHEWVKPAIFQVRGDLSGNISVQDIIEIGKIVPEVRNNEFRPNRVTNTNEGYANNDKKIYEGWYYCAPLVFTKK